LNRRLSWPFARVLLLLLALLLVIAAAGSGSPEPPAGPVPAYDKEATERLEREGWSVDAIRLEGAEQPGVRHVRAEGRIRLPVGRVWQILTGETRGAERDADTWPGIKESIFESARGDTVVRRYLMGVPVYKDRRYRLATVADPDRMQVSFSMIPGYGNVREIEGAWRVVPLGESLTQVIYDLETDPGVRFVPGFIVNWATKNAIPRLYAYIFERGTQLPASGGMGMRSR